MTDHTAFYVVSLASTDNIIELTLCHSHWLFHDKMLPRLCRLDSIFGMKSAIYCRIQSNQNRIYVQRTFVLIC